MQILIIGDGKVGHALAEQLSIENHDITIVDNNAAALRRAVEKLDVLCVRGSGTSIATLKEAGIEKTDLVIAVTSSDEMNMICALMAHKLGVRQIIARIRNPEYAQSEDFLKQELGISLSINPELSAANEISRLLRFPHAHSIENFARGRVEMIELVLQEDDPVLGKRLADLTPELSMRVLFCLVVRGDESFIPNGDTVLRESDHLYVSGEPQHTLQFARYLGHTRQKLRRIMVVGGSRIAYYLARQTEKMGMHTRIIELDPERCAELSQLLPNALILQGDGTDHELLDQERLEDMDAFVALTNRDEENLIACIHARDVGVDKVVAKLNRAYYARLAEDISTINPKELTANRIVRYVRAMENSQGSFVERLYRIAEGQAEVMEFIATRSSRLLGVPLKNLRLKNGILVAAIMHKGAITIPFGNDMIQEGDNVIIVTRGEEIFIDLNDILIGG